MLNSKIYSLVFRLQLAFLRICFFCTGQGAKQAAASQISFKRAAATSSEVVVAFFVLIFIRIHIILTLLIFVDFFFVAIFALILGLETALLCVACAATLRSKARLRLPHLVELLIGAPLAGCIFILLENFILLILCVLVLQPVNDSLSFLFPLSIFKIVHVKLVFQIIDICILLNVDTVVALKLCFKALIFFLVLGLDVFNTLETLIGTFELLLTATNLVVKLSLVLSQLFQSFLHFVHLTGLSIDNVSDALFDVSLLRISIQVAANSIEEVEGFVAG